MTSAVKDMLMGNANKEYMKKVEQKKKELQQLEEEVKKQKEKEKHAKRHD